MNETILNIYLVIDDGKVVGFRVVAYEMEGGDDRKIAFLKSKAAEDFSRSYFYDAPTNKHGEYMPYNKFARLEQQGRQFELFEEIFTEFKVPQNPLICVTPVVDGKVMAGGI